MIKDIVIVGAGGCARETAFIIEDINKENKEWNLLGFIDDNEDIQNKNIKFATLIHPSTKLNSTICIGEGCIVYQNVIATSNITIGDHVIISPKTGIGHDSVIENYCSLLWNVNVSGNVLIKEGVLVGSGATIIQGLTIGKNSTIGAGAVVIRDIPNDKIAVGNPTRLI